MGHDRSAMTTGAKTNAGERRTLEHWVLLVLGIGALALLVVLGTLVEPDPRGFGTHEKLGLGPCKMMQWFGTPCPGCGVTTSISLAAHGRLGASFVNQPFGLLVALILAFSGGWMIVQQFRGVDLYHDLRQRRLGGIGLVLLALMLVAWIYKIAIVRGW